MTDAAEEPTWLTVTQVRTLHAETVRLFGGASGLRDAGLPESAVARPRHRYAHEETSTLHAPAAAYAHGPARNHPFMDGNKRTALLAIRAFLFRNGYVFDPDQGEAVAMMEGLADGTVSQAAAAQWIRGDATPRSESET
jgi:death-on-curing protein